MSEYPEDIMKAAREAIAKYYVDTGETDFAKRIQNGHKDDWWMLRPVAAAILAERERCEKIASNEADRICDNDNDYSGPRVFDMIVTARRIQFAISGEPNIHLSEAVRARITKTSEGAA